MTNCGLLLQPVQGIQYCFHTQEHSHRFDFIISEFGGRVDILVPSSAGYGPVKSRRSPPSLTPYIRYHTQVELLAPRDASEIPPAFTNQKAIGTEA